MTLNGDFGRIYSCNSEYNMLPLWKAKCLGFVFLLPGKKKPKKKKGKEALDLWTKKD